MLDKDENACSDVVTVDLQTLTNSKAPDTGREKAGALIGKPREVSSGNG